MYQSTWRSTRKTELLDVCSPAAWTYWLHECWKVLLPSLQYHWEQENQDPCASLILTSSTGLPPFPLQQHPVHVARHLRASRCKFRGQAVGCAPWQVARLLDGPVFLCCSTV